MVILITGKAGAGKTHYAKTLEKELTAQGKDVVHLDGELFRKLTDNQDFSDKGRKANLMFAAETAMDCETVGKIVICSFVSPKKEWRDMMRAFWRESITIYIPGGSLWKDTLYEPPDFNELKIH